MSAAADAFVPDAEKRGLMNLILLGSVAATVGCLGGPFLYYFYPAGAGGGGGGVIAKDANGDEVTFKGWLDTHQAGERKLVQGLKGDATYLIIKDDKTIETFGLNAVCTHLGCVVPWNKAENKFMCPCHGSQYNDQGKVVRGPAPLSLALAHINDNEGKISLSTWTEEDFRTGLKPWWN
jgi:cytochrome b6-f complex iron-sulfur subunit